MITVHIREGVLGEGHVASQEFQWQPGLTARSIAINVRDRLPKVTPIEVVLNGKLIEDEDCDELLCDGDELILAASTLYGIDIAALIVYALIATAISIGVSYALAALNPQKDPADTPQDRGDDTSATYSWSGIATNRGQGFTVPVIYGTHGAGGQVISTSVLGANDIAGVVDDRLTVTLALSEGPIARIGGTLASEKNFLGSIDGSPAYPSQGALPTGIRVNETLLDNDNITTQAFRIYINWGFAGVIPWTTGDVLVAIPVTGGPPPLVPAAGDPVIIRIENPTSANPGIFLDRDVPEWTSQPAGTIYIYKKTQNGVYGIPHSATFNFISPVTIGASSAGALAFLRDGEFAQSPLPGSPGPFTGVAVTFNPNDQLSQFNESRVFTYATGNDPIARVSFVISAPFGIYQQDPQGNLSPWIVGMRVRWRKEGELTWRLFDNSTSRFDLGYTATEEPQLWTFAFDIAEPVTGNIEVFIQRDTSSGGSLVVSNLVWRNVVFSTPNVFSYPGVALLGVMLQANSRWDGGVPNFSVPCDGIKVRVWDVTNGWSQRSFDVPAAPFDWHTYSPGRNPAWVVLDYLLSDWGLGPYLTEADIDLPAFAAWAVYCDLDPNPSIPWGEPRYTCDIVLDRARPAWEWVVAMMATGRGAPVFVNNKVSVAYEYSAAHAQGSVSVPAKVAVQLFSSGNIENMSVTWLPRATRPTVYIFQFLNEAFEYRQDVLPLEDPEATFNDQSELFPDKYRPAQVQAFGQTRASQIYRDSRYRHRVNRLVARKIDFKTGRWALIAQVGDLFEIETEVMRPFPAIGLLSDVPANGVIFVGGNAVSQVTVDHATLPSSGQIKMRNPAGAPVTALWNATNPVTIEGRSCLELTLTTSVTVDPGCVCIYGTVDKLTETYQMVAVTLNEDLTRTVTALQWVPEVHDDIDPADWDDGESTGLITAPASSLDEPLVAARDVAMTVTEDGKHRVSFARIGSREAQSARVFIRKDASEAWKLIGATTKQFIEVANLTPHESYEVSVTMDRFDGSAVWPQQGVVATVTAPEFRPRIPATVSNLALNEAGDGLDWDEATTLNQSHYEVRVGTNWVGGCVVERLKSNRVRWAVPPTTGQFMVALQMADGSQGNPTISGGSAWVPEGSKAFVNYDDIAATSPGVAANVALDGTNAWLELDADAYTGTYTTIEIDAGFAGPFMWRVALDVHEYDAVTVDDVQDFLASGEVSWRTVDAREASPGKPGVDFQRSVDDAFQYTVDHYEDELVHGQLGEAGSHTRVLLESRYHDGTGWTGEWDKHTDGVRVAQKIQLRLNLDRETLTHEAQVHELTVTAHL